MSYRLLVIAILSCASLVARADETSVVGTWRLVAFEDKSPDGESVYPYGKDPKGLLMYDADGHMSVQVMKVPHPKVASGDDSKVTPEEKQALFDAYVAYFGTYRVDAEKGVVIHHVEADLWDVYIGNDEERPFDLHGDTLILAPHWKVDGREWLGIRVFKRAGP